MPSYNNLPATSENFKGNLFERLVDDLRLAGKAKRTVYGYVRAVRKLAEHCQQSPDRITESQVRQYLLFVIHDCQSASGTQSVVLSGLKFFYRVTCPRDWKVFHQTKLRSVKSLPEVITASQVQQIIDACKTLRMKSFFWTVFSLGLRIGEAVNLQVGDIDRQRMMVHIHRGKGAKDRYIILPNATHKRLREFWKTHRNPKFLFPADGRSRKSGHTADTHMSISTAQDAMAIITKELSFGKKVSTHTLRHSYATSLLEKNVGLKSIQELLGHTSLQTTLVYLHLTQNAQADTRKIINGLFVQPPFNLGSNDRDKGNGSK